MILVKVALVGAPNLASNDFGSYLLSHMHMISFRAQLKCASTAHRRACEILHSLSAVSDFSQAREAAPLNPSSPCGVQCEIHEGTCLEQQS